LCKVVKRRSPKFENLFGVDQSTGHFSKHPSMSALAPLRCLRLSISCFRPGRPIIHSQFPPQHRQFFCTPVNLKKAVKKLKKLKKFQKAVKKNRRSRFEEDYSNTFQNDKFHTTPKRACPELPAIIPELRARGLLSQCTEYINSPKSTLEIRFDGAVSLGM
jgi:hypothetical protein